ncbi:MAG: nucleoside hydrolase [Tannerellaceae bacterium]|nr:nucleoside hydrolase [Tannerellaceae bacterium]
MKKIIFLIAMAMAFGSCRQKPDKATPVSIFFDTDMGGDYDDVGALTILHALADSGEARILATVSSNRYELTAPCIDVINTYFKRPELPIGSPLAGPNKPDDWHADRWTDALAAHFPHTVQATADVPDAVEVYRRILAGEPDSSVVVLTVGFFTNLAALLQSPPDRYSDLDGTQLVLKKVKRLVAMAGTFPQGREYNVFTDSTASVATLERWPTPILFSGWEIGERILTGKRLVASDMQETPAKHAFTVCLRQDNPEGRQSWDETAVLVAVRGVAPYFNTVKGEIIVRGDGSNAWENNPNGKHEYLTWKMPVEELAKVIEDLMMHE